MISVTLGCRIDVAPRSPEDLLPILLELLDDPDPDVRRTATMAVGKIGHPGPAGALVQGLKDPDPLVREYSASSLGSLGEVVRDQAGLAVADLLLDSSDAAKQAAARALGEIGTAPKALDSVIEALGDPDVRTRRAAVLALGRIEAGSAFPALTEAVGDPDALVRQGALAALGELAEDRARPYFRTRLAQDPDQGVRSEAAYRLGKLGTPEDLPLLRLVAAEDRSAVVRGWARWAAQSITPLDGFD